MHRQSNEHSTYLGLKWRFRANAVLLKAAKLASQDGRHDLHCREIEAEQKILEAQIKLWDNLSLLYKYEDQPRVPAGSPDGGQWTDGGSGNGRAWLAQQRQSEKKPTGLQAIATTNWVREAQRVGIQIERELPIGSMIRELPVIASTTQLLSALQSPELEYPLSEALRQYNAIAEADDPYVVPLIAMRAREFSKDDSGTKTWASVHQADIDTIGRFCPRYPDVQTIANKIASTMGPVSLYGSPQNYGTQFHLRAADEINKVWKGQLIPELYLMAPLENAPDSYYRDKVKPREKDSLGLDVFEPVGGDSVCIYDFKTGGTGLSSKRMSHFSYSSAKTFPNLKRFFVIEIRPSVGSKKEVM